MSQLSEQAQNLLLLIPESGSIGNVTLRRNLLASAATTNLTPIEVETYFTFAKNELLGAGIISLGRGKGGSVRRTVLESPESGQIETDTHTLEVAATEEF